MLITCPHCFAKFNLPDDKVADDIRLRCSFCNTIFSLQEGITEDVPQDSGIPEQDDLPELPPKPIDDIPLPTTKKGRSTSIGIFLFLFLFALAGVWVFFTQYKKQEEEQQTKENASINMQEQIKDLSIKDYRQYFITNNPNIKTPFFVVEGKIKNNSADTKAFIVVKASLFNDKGEMIIEQEALAGVALSLFQLQTMKEQDMIDTLKDPLEIAVTNSRVLPQSEVPFMILFFDPPREVTEFSVQIVSATKAQELGLR